MTKKPLNAYFKEMLKAKKNKAKSFTYNGCVYEGKEHPNLGMIYKKSTSSTSSASSKKTKKTKK